jgi:hypothetical protein
LGHKDLGEDFGVKVGVEHCGGIWMVEIGECVEEIGWFVVVAEEEVVVVVVEFGGY